MSMHIVKQKIRTTLVEPYVLKLEHEGKTETTVEHHCTSSIGVVLFIDHAARTEEIIKWADMAMYQAKEAGGNLIRFVGYPRKCGKYYHAFNLLIKQEKFMVILLCSK